MTLDLWILGVFLHVVCCNLFKLGATRCALALWKVRVTKLMKVVWNFSWFLEMAGFARDASE